MDLFNYTSDVYHPTTDSEGNYVDSHVNLNQFSKCGCGTSNSFTPQSFKIHFKSDRHKHWLEYLNHERVNHYSELVKYKKLNKQQQMVIQQQQDIITTNEIKLEQYSKKVFEYKKTIESIKELKKKLEHCDLD
jgi:pyruvate carboxylase